jgi:hypothetical protein
MALNAFDVPGVAEVLKLWSLKGYDGHDQVLRDSNLGLAYDVPGGTFCLTTHNEPLTYAAQGLGSMTDSRVISFKIADLIALVYATGFNTVKFLGDELECSVQFTSQAGVRGVLEVIESSACSLPRLNIHKLSACVYDASITWGIVCNC